MALSWTSAGIRFNPHSTFLRSNSTLRKIKRQRLKATVAANCTLKLRWNTTFLSCRKIFKVMHSRKLAAMKRGKFSPPEYVIVSGHCLIPPQMRKTRCRTMRWNCAHSRQIVGKLRLYSTVLLEPEWSSTFRFSVLIRLFRNQSLKNDAHLKEIFSLVISDA